MGCVVQCLAERRMSIDEVAKVVVSVANMVFGENWKHQNDEDDDEREESEQ